MEILLKFQCQSCDKEFTVLNEQVETDMISCPHCQESVDVGDEEPEVEYEDYAGGGPTRPVPGDRRCR